VRGVEISTANSEKRTANTESRGNPSPSSCSLFAARCSLSAPAIVVTTGTFMRGLMHTGESQTPGGRHGEAPANTISTALTDLGFELGRLKTGTPPRLRRSTIAWDALPEARGDDNPTPFSDLSVLDISHESHRSHESHPTYPTFPALPQIDCRETRTTAAVHALIRANLHRAPMYSGQIESVGPRYCPSIEDKVVRFAERDSHTVFLEPESLRDDWVYCNGISTSLPADVQDQIVRAMPGCENAHVYRYGYAVEYDMVRPHQILATGMTKLVEGLFLAGQINGTSGYEEAAGQGLIAGVNAARYARGQGEWLLGRDQAYIGVMMDDLVTKTPVEPYRMFTSRAEHRLLLRPDNAADRLTPLAIDVGLLGEPGRPGPGSNPDNLPSADLAPLRRELFARRQRDLAELHAAIDSTRINNEPLSLLLRRPEFGIEDLQRALPHLSFPRSVWLTAHADRKYESYLVRQRADIRRAGEMEHRRIPHAADYSRFHSLRPEARQALARFRPATFGQASRLEGITPADLTLLAVLLKKQPLG
jgi:tRNA uridine 5-carboxymethylaminomethyl modification enzyme